MKLTPYWWQHPDVRSGGGLKTPATPLPSKADCVIVGGGFAGLTAALLLARGGRSVVVIDKSQPGKGAACRNGGICSGSIRTRHGDFTLSRGADVADRIYGEAVEARADLDSFIATEKIKCDYHAAGYFRGAVSRRDFEAAAREAESLGKVPGIDIEIISRGEQHGIINSGYFHGGLFYRNIHTFHPARFFAGLMERVVEAGAIICPDTMVDCIDDNGKTAKRVTTGKGVITAGRVIVTTNAYTGRDGMFSRFLRRRLVPVQSAIAVTEDLGTKRIKDMLPRLSSFGTSASLYSYARPTPDGRRFLLGARSLDGLTPGGGTAPGGRTIAALKARMVEVFPDFAGVGLDYAWLGNVAFTRAQIPCLFEHDGVVYVGGYAGSGTVWARWLGRKAAEKLLGSGNEPSVFEAPPPDPVPLYDGIPWFMPAINGWYGLRDMVNERRWWR